MLINVYYSVNHSY